mgnify:FL=1
MRPKRLNPLRSFKNARVVTIIRKRHNFLALCTLRVVSTHQWGNGLNIIEAVRGFGFVPGISQTKRRSRSLAEQMGYSAHERLLIIKCDDLGSSRSANSAIERALREGLASSTTLMIPAPFAREGADACRDFDVGVHLTLTSEFPTYRWGSLTGAASLHDRDGYLPRTTQEVWARAELDDIERECRAQIERAFDWGLDVTHLDSHMDILQLDRHYFAVYMRLAKDYRLPVRLRRSHFESPFSSMSRVMLEKHGILTTDHFVSSPWGEPARPVLMRFVKSGGRGVSEIVLHPVDTGEELFGYDSENADIRAADAECLMDQALQNLVRSNDVRLIGYKPLREAMRRGLAARCA